MNTVWSWTANGCLSKGHRRANVARRIVRNLDAALSATQLGRRGRIRRHGWIGDSGKRPGGTRRTTNKPDGKAILRHPRSVKKQFAISCLGRKPHGRYQGETTADLKRRAESIRVKSA